MSEPKEPSWVDYGNLAANLVQVGQFSAVQGRLKQLAQIEATREERARLINELRQIVFEGEEGLQRIIPYAKRAPAGVLIAVSLLKIMFEEIGIVPQTFEEFADKDRVKTIQQTIEEISNNATQSLNTAELQEAGRILKLIPRLNELEVLITGQSAKEELARTSEEWKRLDEIRRQNRKPWNNLLLISIIALPVCCTIMFGISSLLWNFWNPESATFDQGAVISSVVCFIVILLPLIGIVVATIRISQASPLRLKELEKQRNPYLRQLLPATKFQQLYEEFGELTGDQYKAMRDEAINHVRNATENDRAGKPLEEPLLPLVMPERLLKQSGQQARKG